MSQLPFDPERNIFLVAGDRFEYETLHEDRVVIHRGRITKFVAPDYFEGFLDNGTFISGDSKALKRIPQHIGVVI